MANSNLLRKSGVSFTAVVWVMCDLLILVVHIIATVFRLGGPEGYAPWSQNPV